MPVAFSWNSLQRDTGTQVTIADVGGSCDTNKQLPTLYSTVGGGSTHVTLYTAKGTGSCAFQGSNAQFQLKESLPNGHTGTTKINVTQHNGAGSGYVVQCYDTHDLTCSGTTTARYASGDQVFGLSVTLSPAWGPIEGVPAGYTYCTIENNLCHPYDGGRGRADVAFGRFGKYTYAKVDSSFNCGTKEFADPIPSVPKACFYKKLS